MSNNLMEKPNGNIDEKLDWLISAVQSIDSRLVTLDTKVDKRLRETQPMWEAVQSQLSEVIETLQRHGEILQRHGEILERNGEILERNGEMLQRHGEMLQRHGEILQRHEESLQRLAEDVTSLRGEVGSLRADTEKGFQTIDRRMERQLGEFERLHAYQRDLEDRIDRIEKLSSQ